VELNEMERIRQNYLSILDELEEIGRYHLNLLSSIKGVHALNYRIKKVDHLIEKIKRKEAEDRKINLDNYMKEITDLIGIRIIHTFKDEWKNIDMSIRENYELIEEPKAYIRKGDNDEEDFCEFDKKIHESGYRSLHYLVNTKPRKEKYIIEIQVRTIFAEAWGEIDHTIRYPNISDDAIIKEYSLILNSLAGIGDEMGINIRKIKSRIDDARERELELNKKENPKKEDVLNELMERLGLSIKEKEDYLKKFIAIEKEIIDKRNEITNIKYGFIGSFYTLESILESLKKNSDIKIKAHENEGERIRITCFINNKLLVNIFAYQMSPGLFGVRKNDSTIRLLIDRKIIKANELSLAYY
jgi:ppGpp synthetase/RelA/SpoT-type nucleotidyltranferase